MLRSAAGSARVRGPAIGRITRCRVFNNNAGTRRAQGRLDPTQQQPWRRRYAVTAVAASRPSTAKRPPAAVAAAWSLRPLSYSASSATIPRRGGGGCSMQQQQSPAGGTGGPIVKFWAPQQQQPPCLLVSARRHFSTSRRGLPPRRSLRERVFAGVVMVVLAAWGLVFGGKGGPMDSFVYLFTSRNIKI